MESAAVVMLWNQNGCGGKLQILASLCTFHAVKCVRAEVNFESLPLNKKIKGFKTDREREREVGKKSKQLR